MTTLLERWDKNVPQDFSRREFANEIRRALAIAQAYNEWGRLEDPLIRRDEKNLLLAIGRRADELLRGGRNG